MNIRDLPMDGALNELSLVGGRIKTKLNSLSQDVDTLAKLEGLVNIIPILLEEDEDQQTSYFRIDQSTPDLVNIINSYAGLDIDDTTGSILASLQELLLAPDGTYRRTFIIPDWSNGDRVDYICYLTLYNMPNTPYWEVTVGHESQGSNVTDGVLIELYHSSSGSSYIRLHNNVSFVNGYTLSTLPSMLIYNISEMFSANSLWLDTIQGMLNGGWTNTSEFIQVIKDNISTGSNYIKDEFEQLKSIILNGQSTGLSGIATSLLLKFNITNKLSYNNNGQIWQSSEDESKWTLTTINLATIGRGILKAVQWIGQAALIIGTPIVKVVGGAIYGVSAIIDNINNTIVSGSESSINNNGLLPSWYGNIPMRTIGQSFLKKLKIDAYPTIIDTGYVKIALSYSNLVQNSDPTVEYRVYSNALVSGSRDSQIAFAAALDLFGFRWLDGSKVVTLGTGYDSNSALNALNEYLQNYSLSMDEFEGQSETEKANSYAISTAIMLIYLYTWNRGPLASNIEPIVFSHTGVIGNGGYTENELIQFVRGEREDNYIYFSPTVSDYIRNWTPPLYLWYIAKVWLFCKVFGNISFDDTIYFKNVFTDVLRGEFGSNNLLTNQFLFNIDADTDNATSYSYDFNLLGSNYGINTNLIYTYGDAKYISVSGVTSLSTASYMDGATSYFATRDWNLHKDIYREEFYIANNSTIMVRYYPPRISTALVNFVKTVGIAIAVALTVGAVIMTYKAVTRNKRQSNMYAEWNKACEDYKNNHSDENYKRVRRTTRALSWDTKIFGSSKYLSSLSGARFGWGNSSGNTNQTSQLLSDLIRNDNQAEQSNPSYDLSYIVALIRG